MLTVMVVQPVNHDKQYKNLLVKLKFLPIHDYELAESVRPLQGIEDKIQAMLASNLGL